VLKNSWLFPIVQSVHLAGIALFVGTIILQDLRILGMKHRPARAFWTTAGMAVMAATGPFLFFADAGRYLNNPAFLFKMAVLLVAVAFHFTIHRKQTKSAAVVSMILWSLVVIGGRAIADFDV
jgi:hypothetical protein